MNISVQQKQRTNNKTEWDVRTERDSGRATLLNFANGNKVEIFWGYNDAVSKDRMFLIKVGGKEAILDSEEVRRFLRWV